MHPKLKVAVITEWHPIDVIAFQKLFEGFPEFECYIQSLELFVTDEKNRGLYDAVVYYNLSMPLLSEDSKTYQYFTREMGTASQGIFLLHHAILCYNGWELWSELSGVNNRKFTYHQNQTVDFRVEKPDHPIMAGLRDWRMTDETYRLEEVSRPGSDVFITADHPMSIRNIAWTRQYRNSRVVCYASGHDDAAYQDPSFRAVLRNGILWSAKRL